MGFFSIFGKGARRRPADPHTEMLKEMNYFGRYTPEEYKEKADQIAKVSPDIAADCAKFLSAPRDEALVSKITYLDHALKDEKTAELLLKAVIAHYPYLCEIGMEPPLAIMLGIFKTLGRYDGLTLHQQRALIRMESSRVINANFVIGNFRVELTEYPEYITEVVISAPEEVERIIGLIQEHPKAHRAYFETLLKGSGAVPLAAGEL